MVTPHFSSSVNGQVRMCRWPLCHEGAPSQAVSLVHAAVLPVAGGIRFPVGRPDLCWSQLGVDALCSL